MTAIKLGASMPFVPLHRSFSGKHSVAGEVVNLNTGLCSCKWGKPFIQGYDGKVIPNAYCGHKLQAIFDMMSQDDADQASAYVKALGSRYNVYEAVSAFHKELRRRDVNAAWYWAQIVSTKRGWKGVVKYMLNILYEETREHNLGVFLLQIYTAFTSKNPNAGLSDVYKAMFWFCMAPKKWELPHRYAVFMAEMGGYKDLAKKYGYEVARAQDIIPDSETLKLLDWLERGIENALPTHAQAGLKGLLKSQSAVGHAKHKLWLFDKVQALSKRGNKDAEKLGVLLSSKRDVMKDMGYHDINAYVDCLLGEKFESGLVSGDGVSAIMERGYENTVLGVDIRTIPLYAQDSHTWSGKAKMRKYPEELLPGAIQRNMDFRWTGTYLGVAWRTLAYKQFGTLDGVKWGAVDWPDGLYEHASKMVY